MKGHEIASSKYPPLMLSKIGQHCYARDKLLLKENEILHPETVKKRRFKNYSFKDQIKFQHPGKLSKELLEDKILEFMEQEDQAQKQGESKSDKIMGKRISVQGYSQLVKETRVLSPFSLIDTRTTT